MEGICTLLIFDPRSSLTISHIFLNHQVRNFEVTPSVQSNHGKSIYETVNLCQLKWLGDILCVHIHLLLQRTMTAALGVG